MPELPEVETVKRSLAEKLIGEKIVEIDIYYSGNIREPEPELLREMLRGNTFQKINRRGKYLIFSLSGDLALVVHLRMTGQLLYVEPTLPVDKHTHLVFSLSGGQELRYVDLRKFGTFDLVPQGELKFHKGLSILGMEPLSPEFTVEWLAEQLHQKNRSIKNVLLDQTIIAGIGNIYADEILFEARIHPETIAGELNQEQITVLQQAVVKMLNLGITHRGTSIRNYVDGDGRQGGFQELLRVYGRKGNACELCGQPIAKTKVQGRGTYFCPYCQQ
ncbi:MAG: bifunctional DNA-formamidopyrimidine glycosylase/DNA-(apurinic or apyrimidinic site) lyase [Clostridia bacterium]|nr:bifunctional DNA-formamidopyrimidine glycosylase/DNA-(apurinic or apyrimidinic site) lyase [Clostridia bacterium]